MEASALRHHLPNACLALRQITIGNFRNYDGVRLDVTPCPILLTGENGSGKTNLLEAISLFVPGKGLRRADFNHLQNKNKTEGWSLSANFHTPQGIIQIGTGADSQEDKNRRLVHIDGKNTRGQNALADIIAMTWVTPDMDRILGESAGERRRFLDRLVFSFDAGHRGRLSRYEKLIRERLFLLRANSRDHAWLSALEKDIAETSVAIAAARHAMVCALQKSLELGDSIFPKADLRLIGIAEEQIAGTPALIIEDKLRVALEQARTDDSASGHSSIGIHRSDLAVTHRAKNLMATFCSSGEQKALLITIILAYARMIKDHRGVTPLLLLDDIAAHLDEVRRDALFTEILALKIQAWITGTDKNDFTSLHPHAQHFIVRAGHIS